MTTASESEAVAWMRRLNDFTFEHCRHGGDEGHPSWVVCWRCAEAFARSESAAQADEILRLKGLIDRDKTGLAFALNKIQRIAKGFDWICEGRGPYVYDDDRYRMEVGSLIVQVLAVAQEHLAASGSLADEAFHPRAKETANMLASRGGPR
jgi:hypothetical protein